MEKRISKKKLPIGIEAFDETCSEDFYYVDKTGLIRDFLDIWGKVNLFTRPRRFSKSLNMSMFKAFFEMDCDKKLFDGLEIPFFWTARNLQSMVRSALNSTKICT